MNLAVHTLFAQILVASIAQSKMPIDQEPFQPVIPFRSRTASRTTAKNRGRQSIGFATRFCVLPACHKPCTAVERTLFPAMPVRGTSQSCHYGECGPRRGSASISLLLPRFDRLFQGKYPCRASSFRGSIIFDYVGDLSLIMFSSVSPCTRRAWSRYC